MDALGWSRLLVSKDSSDSKPALLRDVLSRLPRGVRVERVKSGTVENLVLIKQFSKSGPVLAFNGHYDTVPISDGWITPPLTPTVKAGKLFGLGSADMKGGVAAMLSAFIALCERPSGLSGTLELHLVGDEEHGGFHGTRAVLAKRKAPDACVNGEPTNLDLAVSTKGVIHAKLEAFGKSAHGSRPHHGQNAIEMLHAALVPLWKRFPTRKVTNANALRSITLNVGTITGGTARNVVPSRASAELDFRFPAKSYARDRKRVLAALRGVARAGVKMTLIEDEPAWMAPQSSAFVQLAKKTLSQVTRKGKPVRVLEKTGATDARFYGAMGVPTVNVGPGDPFVIHKPNEFVPVNELALAAEFYERLAREFLQTK